MSRLSWSHIVLILKIADPRARAYYITETVENNWNVHTLDRYVRMFDERERQQGDNPILGIVLCTETDQDIARYSVLKGSEQLFASKYKLYLPTEEELRVEIEREKLHLRLQMEQN